MPRGVNWIAVRTAYVVKGYSAQKCSEEFGVDITTVKKRASAEGWTQERHRNTTNATLVAQEEARAVVAVAAEEIRTAHASLILRLHNMMQGCEEDIQASKPGRPRAETRRAVMDALEKGAKIGRMALGFSEGQSSIANAEDDGRKRVTFELPDEDVSESA